MFGRLIAMEWRHTRRMYVTGLAVFVATWAVSIGLMALHSVNDSVIVSTLAGIGFVVAHVTAWFLPVGAFSAAAMRYYKALYTAEGYFTLAIPVPARAMYWAKLLYGWAVTLLAAGLAVAMQRGIAPVAPVRGAVQVIVGEPETPPAWVIALFVVYITFAMFVSFSQLITMMHDPVFRGSKLLGFIAVYVGTQVVSMVLIGLAVLFPSVLTLVNGQWTIVTMSALDAARSSQPNMPVGLFFAVAIQLTLLIVATIFSLGRRTALR